MQHIHNSLPNKAPLARLTVPSANGWQTHVVGESRLQSSNDALWRSKDNCLEVYQGDTKSQFEKGRLLKSLATEQGTFAACERGIVAIKSDASPELVAGHRSLRCAEQVGDKLHFAEGQNLFQLNGNGTTQPLTPSPFRVAELQALPGDRTAVLGEGFEVRMQIRDGQQNVIHETERNVVWGSLTTDGPDRTYWIERSKKDGCQVARLDGQGNLTKVDLESGSHRIMPRKSGGFLVLSSLSPGTSCLQGFDAKGKRLQKFAFGTDTYVRDVKVNEFDNLADITLEKSGGNSSTWRKETLDLSSRGDLNLLSRVGLATGRHSARVEPWKETRTREVGPTLSEQTGDAPRIPEEANLAEPAGSQWTTIGGAAYSQRALRAAGLDLLKCAPLHSKWQSAAPLERDGQIVGILAVDERGGVYHYSKSDGEPDRYELGATPAALFSAGEQAWVQGQDGRILHLQTAR